MKQIFTMWTSQYRCCNRSTLIDLYCSEGNMLKYLSINISLLSANSPHLTVRRVHNAGEKFPELGQVSEAGWELVDKQNLERSNIYILMLFCHLFTSRLNTKCKYSSHVCMRDLTWLMTSCLEVIFKLNSRQTTATTLDLSALQNWAVPAFSSHQF